MRRAVCVCLCRQVAMTETKYERAKAVISAVAINGGTEQRLTKERQVSNLPVKAKSIKIILRVF